jgi:2'-5' RNA ligase
VVAQIQMALSSFPGFHMTPLDNLHITTLLVGSTDDISRSQMSAMVSAAQDLLAQIAPIPVLLDQILYHPEAIMLAVRPASALSPVRHAAQSATRMATGHAGTINESEIWTPHITASYSTTNQPATPIIAALGKKIEPCEVIINTLSLVIQWGAERHWKWERVGTARLSR